MLVGIRARVRSCPLLQLGAPRGAGRARLPAAGVDARDPRGPVSLGATLPHIAEPTPTASPCPAKLGSGGPGGLMCLLVVGTLARAPECEQGAWHWDGSGNGGRAWRPA